jgi:hypothetical protein
MFGSLDCTHWVWKNCPVGWQGHYQDRKGQRSIVMEAVATEDLRIWHAFIGIPGSNNDINVLDRSTLMPQWFKSPAIEAEFQLNGIDYKGSYLLADGIYPDSKLFVKTLHNPQSAKLKHFAARQEGVRKDVERCFGVLKSRFAILNIPSRLWDVEIMKTVWTAAVILHNMILEDENEADGIVILADEQDGENDVILDNGQDHPDEREQAEQFRAFCAWRLQISDSASITKMRSDLIDHLWNLKGNDQED